MSRRKRRRSRERGNEGAWRKREERKGSGVVSGIKRGDTHIQRVTKGQITDDNTTVGCVTERTRPNDK